MSDGPARFTVSVRTQKDKFGPGVEFFLGYDSVAEGIRDLAEQFGTETTDQLLEMAKQQITTEHSRMSGVVVSGAVDNLANAGMLPQQPLQINEPASANGARQCPHGEMDLVAKFNSWFCKLDKNDPRRCKPVDAKTGKPWK